MKLKILRCDKHICRVFLPWETLVLLPESRVFEPIWKLTPYMYKKLRTGCVVELPNKTFIRVGKTPKAKYYLVDRELVELIGKKAKIIGLNVWGWHYVDPRTKETVLTVVYVDGVFEALTRLT